MRPHLHVEAEGGDGVTDHLIDVGVLVLEGEAEEGLEAALVDPAQQAAREHQPAAQAALRGRDDLLQLPGEPDEDALTTQSGSNAR